MKFIFTILLLVICAASFATHNRAGEITYRQISALEYEVTVITYTFTLSPADRPDLEIQWGDDTKSIIGRVETIYLPNNYKRSKYVGRHTYPGPGTYTIVVEDPNRNYGVQNIPNSVNVVFSIRTIMKISAGVGFNNTPVLTTAPIDKAAVGRLFIHNPGAYDPDGDSLSYKLTKCTGENGVEIPGYTFPEASDTLYINEITGDLVWDSPVRPGVYNVAIFIEEWRNGAIIGKIERDMQIEVYDADNYPPKIIVNENYCVEADSVLRFNITATDSEGEVITLTASGGPFMVEDFPANFTVTKDTASVTAPFRWDTKCLHARKQPYQVIFKAQDSNADLRLVDQKNVNIFVILPEPENVQLVPTNNTIFIQWNPDRCNNISGYRIYRREGPSGFIPDSCQTGVPESTGYIRIAETTGWNNCSFLDNNNGLGLLQGYQYCYIVTAFMDDGAESYASKEICTELIRGIPVITNVSVTSTDSLTGSIYVAWAKPTQLDTLQSRPNGPYKYYIYRSDDLWGNENLRLVDSLSNITDTTYFDLNVNTKSKPHAYKIEFYNDSVGKRFLIGSPSIASSVYLNIEAADNKLKLNFDKNVPWLNERYFVFRKNNESGLFDDSSSVTTNEFYIDSGLANGTRYTYKIKSVGNYHVPGFVNPIINYSQIAFQSPKDTLRPCAPVFTVKSNCDSVRNELSWTNPNLSCADDVVGYRIYYSPVIDGEMNLISEIQPATKTEFYHYPELTMAACYYVTAIDSFGNESRMPQKLCIDSCSYYELPNVFTPNDDNANDFFTPLKRKENKFIEKVEMKIYDRWGVLVFSTSDPNINWNGRNMSNNKKLATGVYYYVCEVYERRLIGTEPRSILGFVHLLWDKSGQQNK